ncbi:MAG: phosphotransferase [Deltaproteobacteria bacterium]|nr:phosphotransferase [Deltaproteobacteria bacterium]
MNDFQNCCGPAEEYISFIRDFLKERAGVSAVFDLHDVPADGSNRRFWRICHRSSGLSFIAVMNEPVDAQAGRENYSYLMIGDHLWNKGLPVPKIHASNIEKGWFITEDLGNRNLQDVASSTASRVALYGKVVEVLFRLQIKGAEGFNPSWTCQTEKYDFTVMRRYEADYFKDAFLGTYMRLKREWPELESSLGHIAAKACVEENCYFLHRDFQSRNIMVREGEIGILDWQGGRLGPLAYDLASLLIDPYTPLSKEEKILIYEKYLMLLSEVFPEKVEVFNRSFPYLAIQRNLQILGAFSFLSRVRKKIHFERYIPAALVNLCGLLTDLKDERLSLLTELIEGQSSKFL